MNVKRVIGITLAIGVGSEIVYFLWKNRLISRVSNYVCKMCVGSETKSLSSPIQQGDGRDLNDQFFYEVLIFPDKRRACRPHFWEGGCRYENCRFSHSEENSMGRFVSHVLSAQRTLDVCVYVITDTDLADCVIGMKSKGVLVRVITNRESGNYTGTQVGKFRARGIQVRNNLDYLMHHKFVVVDNRKVITGSFNWTSHATTANNENVIITDNPQVVQPYVQEFDKLWKQFDLSEKR